MELHIIDLPRAHKGPGFNCMTENERVSFKEWCEQNCTETYYWTGTSGITTSISFSSEFDAMAFKLRWT